MSQIAGVRNACRPPTSAAPSASWTKPTYWPLLVARDLCFVAGDQARFAREHGLRLRLVRRRDRVPAARADGEVQDDRDDRQARGCLGDVAPLAMRRRLLRLAVPVGREQAERLELVVLRAELLEIPRLRAAVDRPGLHSLARLEPPADEELDLQPERGERTAATPGSPPAPRTGGRSSRPRPPARRAARAGANGRAGRATDEKSSGERFKVFTMASRRHT